MATVHGAAESDTTEPLHFLSFCGAGSSLVAQLVKSLPAMWEIRVQPLGWEDSPGEGNGNPLQYFCLENSVNRGSWQAIVHGVTKSQTGLSDCHSLTWER